jgi:hypothetical protein
MKEILRFTATRTPEKVAKSKYSEVGILAYPSTYSEFVLSLQRLCKEGNITAYLKYAKTFVEGKTFVNNVSSLSPNIQEVFNYLEYKGANAKYEDIKGMLWKTATPNENAGHVSDRIKVADSLVAVSVLGIAGDKCTLNYQLILKAIYIVEKNSNCSTITSDFQIKQVLTSPIILPENILPGSCECKDNPISTKTKRKFSRILPIVDEDKNNEENEDSDNSTTTNSCKCEFDPNAECEDIQNTGCAVLKPYIMNFFMVKEETARYEQGDIASIYNILKNETLVRDHRFFKSIEQFTETETTTTKSEERDLQISDKTELQSEISETVKKETSLDAGVSSTFKYGESLTVNASVDFASDYSKESSQRLARSYAKDIIDRSISKLEEKVRKLTSITERTEVEEKNNHTIDNKGSDSYAGIYYWVNKVSKYQMFDFGARLAFDCVLIEPSELYKHLKKQHDDSEEISIPEKPSISPKDISDDPLSQYFYLNLAKDNEITGLTAPPTKVKTVSSYIEWYDPLIKEDDEEPKHLVKSFPDTLLTIPDDYFAKSIRVNGGMKWDVKKDHNWGDMYLFVGDVVFYVGRATYDSNGDIVVDSDDNVIEHYDLSPNPQFFSNKFTNTIHVTFKGENVGMFIYNIIIECERTNESYEAWQIGVYDKIMTKYQQDLDKYNAEIKEQKLKEERENQSREEGLFTGNPFLNREIERRELKHQFLTMLTCQYFDDFNAMKRNTKPCGFPKVHFKQAEEEGKIIQFFEQAFEWNLMVYIFYSPYYGDNRSYAEKINYKSGDPIFDKFLGAGAARIQVPVRPGYENLIDYYLQFGEVWGQEGVPPIYGDPYWISVAQELKEQQGSYYSDRAGVIIVTKDSIQATYIGSDLYAYDANKEIVIDCRVYRIVSIDFTNPSNIVVILDKPYEGETQSMGIPFQIGAIYSGAPWEGKMGMNLVYLENEETQLPKYPIS